MSRREFGINLDRPRAEMAASGRKTQHRLPITADTTFVDGHNAPALFRALVWNLRVFVDSGPSPGGNLGPYLHVPHGDGDTVHRVYPRFYLGDRFWVRENWFQPHGGGNLAALRFEARGDTIPEGERWRSGWRLPRSYARTVLEIVSFKIEGVAGVGELDARAEGFPCDLHPVNVGDVADAPCGCLVSTTRFREAWREEHHGAEGETGDRLLWCWSYTVERTERRR